VPNNPNCARTWASLRLLGRVFDAAEVTRRLQLRPSEAFTRGDAYAHGARPRSFWTLRSDQLASTDLQDHLTWLQDRIEPHRSELGILLEAGGIRGDFPCHWMSATGEGGPILSAALLHRVASFGLDLSISFLDLSETAEAPPDG
jgi:hypothetical protein